MKNLLQRLFRKLASFWIDYPRIGALQREGLESLRYDTLTNLDRKIQVLLTQVHLLNQRLGFPRANFDDIQFRSNSQNGEDGILLQIFALIGTSNKKAVELCAGDGMECNTANLIIQHGWTGLLVDGDENNVKKGRHFYGKRCKDTILHPPKFLHSWITAENINDLISAQGFGGEIDLLSLDLDGIDYWVWKNLEVVSPRVVVLEYNPLWPSDSAVTVPNEKNFKGEFFGHTSDYAGASLRAFVKLGKEKGYRLIGAERLNYNAFFMVDGVGESVYPEVSVDSCLSCDFVSETREHRWNRIKDRPWVTV